LFQELKEFLRWGDGDEAVLRGLHAILSPDFARITDVFYQRVLEHQGARAALMGGESQVGRLKITLASYPDRDFSGKIGFIYPTVTPETRTAKVRIEVANPGG
jgi:hypothetical protein